MSDSVTKPRVFNIESRVMTTGHGQSDEIHCLSFDGHILINPPTQVVPLEEHTKILEQYTFSLQLIGDYYKRCDKYLSQGMLTEGYLHTIDDILKDHNDSHSLAARDKIEELKTNLKEMEKRK